ncbi:MAG: sulfotransferase [Chloroflexota bacterium]
MTDSGDRPTSTARRYATGASLLLRSLRSPRGRAAMPATVEVAPPAPDGWVVAPPDFIGVGTARSGTTWWDSLIHQHPDVARADGVPKEVHFFDRFWQSDCGEADVAAYHAFFARPAGKHAGEWTPGYMLDPWTPPLLRRAAPDARYLVLLRDPVERFRSGRTLAENRLTVGSSPRAAANAGFQRGVYADQLLRLWKHVPREQVLVLQYERCVHDPLAELRRTFAFLGLDTEVANTLEVARVVNESKGPKVDLSLDQRTALVARYAPENRRLAALLGDELDLSLWASPVAAR